MIFTGNAVFLILCWLFTASLPLNDIPVHFNEQVEQLNIEIKLSHGSSPEKKNTHVNKQTTSSEKKKTYKDEQQQDARQVSVRDVSLVPSILRNSNNDNEKGKKRNRQERGAKPKIGNTKPSAKKVEKKKASKMKKGYKKKFKKKIQTLKSTVLPGRVIFNLGFLIDNRHKLEYSENYCTRSAVDCAADCNLYCLMMTQTLQNLVVDFLES